MNYQETQGGFSLVELSIVILIMGLLLGGLMMPLSVQRENARLRRRRPARDRGGGNRGVRTGQWTFAVSCDGGERRSRRAGGRWV